MYYVVRQNKCKLHLKNFCNIIHVSGNATDGLWTADLRIRTSYSSAILTLKRVTNDKSIK